MNIKSLAERKAWHMPRWVRSLVPPLFGGLLGGAITFVVLSIVAITYLGVLHQFQTLVIGILAIVASLIALFGVHMQILNARKIEENRLKRDAFAFATALLRQTEDFQSKIALIYHLCDAAVQNGPPVEGLRRFRQDMHEMTVPELFEAPWRDMGLLNPDIVLISHSIRRSLRLVKIMAASNPWLEEWLNPFGHANEAEKEKAEGKTRDFLRQQVGLYEDLIKGELQVLIAYLETEAEEYAIQLGLDEERRRLRAQARARRDARSKAEAPEPRRGTDQERSR